MSKYRRYAITEGFMAVWERYMNGRSPKERSDMGNIYDALVEEQGGETTEVDALWVTVQKLSVENIRLKERLASYGISDQGGE